MSRNDPLQLSTQNRRSARLVFASLLGFVGFMAASMWLYPGGTWLDRSAAGHHFFANFFCDLTQPVSLSGVPNRWGARWAQLGMSFFAVALAGFFWLLPGHFTPQRRVARAVRALGECSVVGLLAVPFTPSEVFGSLHAWLALVSGGFGIGAALLAVIALGRARRRALATLGGVALAAALLAALSFVAHLHDAAPPPLLVPASQKVAALLLCAWMIAGAWLALGQAEVTLRP